MARLLKVVGVVLFVIFISGYEYRTHTNEKNIQFGEVKLTGTSQNWDVAIDINTKVSVKNKNNSEIIVPLDASGLINLHSKKQYSDYIKVEYLLTNFETRGTIIYPKGGNEASVTFQGGLPHTVKNNRYDLRLIWRDKGVQHEETIAMKQN